MGLTNMNIASFTAYVLILLPNPSFSWVDCYTDSVARTMSLKMLDIDPGTCWAVNVCANAEVSEVIISNGNNVKWSLIQNDDGTQDLKLSDDGWVSHTIEATLTWTCPDPEIISVTGYWQGIAESSGSLNIDISYGTTHTEEVDDTNTWGQSVTNSMSAKFGVMNIFGLSAEVDTQTTQTVSSTNKDVFTTTDTTTFQYSFDAGYVWQWFWNTVDTDGNSTSKTNYLATTAGAYAPPCCIPGYFTDVTNPTGSCAADGDNATYTLC
mmetsp:Transcript_50925/g.65213  ORF Transcript_50925/g.65213 Transcript_50925/m.65213 type:complete len:266 (-) Transcript_50925:140-937(-)